MNLSRLTAKWIDTPWKDIGCMPFVHRFLEEALDRRIPDNFGTLSIGDYYDAWLNDREGVENLFCRALVYYTQPSDPRHPRLLDLLAVQIRNDGIQPAVYVGNSNAIACFIKNGVQVFNLDDNNRVLLAGSFTTEQT